MMHIFHSLFILREYVLMLVTSAKKKKKQFLSAKLLKQGYPYHKIRKAFSKFYQRLSELIVKKNIELKTIMQHGISEPVFLW